MSNSGSDWEGDERDNSSIVTVQSPKPKNILGNRGAEENVEHLLKWVSCERTNWKPDSMHEDMEDEIANYEKTLEGSKEEEKRVCKIKGIKRGPYIRSSNDDKDLGVSGGKKYKSSVGTFKSNSRRSYSEMESDHSPTPKIHNQSNYVCDSPGCDRSFSCQTFLTIHKQKAHTMKECRICKISTEDKHNSIIASQNDVRAHFEKFHPGIRGAIRMSYIDECSEAEVTENGNDDHNNLLHMAHAAQDFTHSLKSELQALQNEVSNKDKEIEFLKSQLRSVEADKHITEKKLMDKEDELENARQQITQLDKSLLKKEANMEFLIIEGTDLQRKYADLEFTHEQLLLETEANANPDIKQKCQCNEKVSELESALLEARTQIENEREEHQNVERKLKSTNDMLRQEKDEIQVLLNEVETDKQNFITSITEKEEQLESSLIRNEQFLKIQREKDSSIKSLEIELDRLNETMRIQFQMTQLHSISSEAQNQVEINVELDDYKQRNTDLEKSLKETIHQLEEAREENEDRKSKMEAMTIMWRMENETIQKKLDNYLEESTTTTID